MKKLLACILIVYSQVAQPACDKPVTYTFENTPAACTGYLFTPEKELEVRLKVGSYDTLEKLSNKKDELITVMSDRLDGQIRQNVLLSKELESRKNVEFWHSAGFFILGCVITGFIAGQVAGAGK